MLSHNIFLEERVKKKANCGYFSLNINAIIIATIYRTRPNKLSDNISNNAIKMKKFTCLSLITPL